MPCRLETFLALELNQGLSRARAQYAVRSTDVEASFIQDDLKLPDFILTQIYGPAFVDDRRCATGARRRPGVINSGAG